jgi:DNA gyrase subunit A
MLQQVMTEPGKIIFREIEKPQPKAGEVLVKIMNIGASDKVSAAARMVAHKKKAAKADPMQAALDLSAAGEVEKSDEESVDIGGDEAFDESMIEDE